MVIIKPVAISRLGAMDYQLLSNKSKVRETSPALTNLQIHSAESEAPIKSAHPLQPSVLSRFPKRSGAGDSRPQNPTQTIHQLSKPRFETESRRVSFGSWQISRNETNRALVHHPAHWVATRPLKKQGSAALQALPHGRDGFAKLGPPSTRAARSSRSSTRQARQAHQAHQALSPGSPPAWRTTGTLKKPHEALPGPQISISYSYFSFSPLARLHT